jgi:putative iron-only hydrogenase system regulator
MRYAIIGICVSSRGSVEEVNSLISENSCIVMGRMGMPIREKGLRLISLIVEGNTDIIGKLSGRIGQLPGVEVKSMMMPNSLQSPSIGTDRLNE